MWTRPVPSSVVTNSPAMTGQAAALAVVEVERPGPRRCGRAAPSPGIRRPPSPSSPSTFSTSAFGKDHPLAVELGADVGDVGARRRRPRCRAASTASSSRPAAIRSLGTGEQREADVDRTVLDVLVSLRHLVRGERRCRSAGNRGRPCGPRRGSPCPRAGAGTTRPTRCSRSRASRRGLSCRPRSRSARSAVPTPRRR